MLVRQVAVPSGLALWQETIQAEHRQMTKEPAFRFLQASLSWNWSC